MNWYHLKNHLGPVNLSLKVQFNLDMSKSVDSNFGKVKIFLTSCFKLNLLLFSQYLIYQVSQSNFSVPYIYKSIQIMFVMSKL